jgi:hypothetical protein
MSLNVLEKLAENGVRVMRNGKRVGLVVLWGHCRSIERGLESTADLATRLVDLCCDRVEIL